jgi:hypothetical protein
LSGAIAPSRNYQSPDQTLGAPFKQARRLAACFLTIPHIFMAGGLDHAAVCTPAPNLKIFYFLLDTKK